MSLQAGPERYRLLEAPILPLFFKLSIPAILGMLTIGLYQFVDGIFIGQWVGSAGVGAMALVFPLTLINNGLTSWVGVGASSILSRAIGEKNEDRIRRVFSTLAFLTICLSVLLIVLGEIYARPLLYYFGGRGEILDLAEQYLRIILIGSLAVNLGNSANMLIRAQGRMKTAMRIMAFGTILNLILDPVFMLGFNMGMRGAAVASVIAQYGSAILSCLICMRPTKKHLHFRLSFSHINLPFSREVLKIGFSGMAMPVIMLVQIFFILKAVEIHGGENELILIGAILRILNFIYIPIWGMAQGLQPLVGINYGAKRYQRVRQIYGVFTLSSTLLAIVIWVAINCFPGSTLAFFINDPAIVAEGIVAFRIYIAFFALYGFMIMTMTFFQAIGRAREAALLVLGRMLVFFIPAVLIFPLYIGTHGIWAATPFSDLLVVIIGAIIISRTLSQMKKWDR